MRHGLPALIVALLLVGTPMQAQTPVFGATGDQQELFVPLYFAGEYPSDLTVTSWSPRADAYRQNLLTWSYGRLRLTVQWQDWLPLDIAATCDTNAITSATGRALTAAGWTTTTLAPYRKITAFVPNGCPSFNGQAAVGGRMATLYGSLSAWEHEALHRFGLYHAGLRVTEPDGRAFLVDLGNPFSVMGGVGREINGPERVRLGWLPASQVAEALQPQEFVLRTLAAVDPLAFQVIRTPLGPNTQWARNSDGSEALQPSLTTLFLELRATVSGPLVVFHGTFTDQRWWYLGSLGVGSTAFAGVSVDVLELDPFGQTARVRVTPVATEPPPVDCVLSDWSEWAYSDWSAWAVVGDHEARTRLATRTRAVLTEPSNGGQACGTLTESVTDTETRPLPLPAPADTVAPAVTLAVVQNGKSHNYTVTATATDASGVTSAAVLLNGTTLATFTASWTGTVTLKAKGTYAFMTRATDAAGNVGTVTTLIAR